MRYLGIDYGGWHIGLALSDVMGKIAFPYSIIDNNGSLIQKVLDIVLREGVGVIVLGKSVDYRGEDNPVMGDIEEIKNKVEGEGLKVEYEDEGFTTREARNQPGAKGRVDDSAAAIILQSFLDKKEV